MKSWSIFGLIFISLLVVCSTAAEKRRKNQNFDMDVDVDDYDRSLSKKNSGKHEYKKYSKEFSDESANGQQSQKSKGRKNRKKLEFDLDNLNEDELSSDELAVLEYRRKKLERLNKKTLSDVFAEKKQKKKQRKQKFEKNVLKHFKNDDDDNGNTKSSEEVMRPLKRGKGKVVDDCNSSEERC